MRFVCLVALAACAPRLAPPPTAPARPPSPTPTASPLTPPPAAERVADRVRPRGDELGTMWTFENPPLDRWQRRYGFRPSPAWLERVRLAALRFDESCSAAFVSPDGLAMTNHHCVRECVEAVTRPGERLVEEGFLASRREDERICPELYLDQLVGWEDVTAQVETAAPVAASDTQATRVRRQTADRLEEDCRRRTGLVCQVVELYRGGRYHLYRYRRYAPVALVFAPELQAGYFGGDEDNFTYPRFAVDVAFVRAYDGERPARTPVYLPLEIGGARDGDLVFVVGNPGSTSRLTTVAQVLFERAFRHPFLLDYLVGQKAVLERWVRRQPQLEGMVRTEIFSLENARKAYAGQYAALQDSLLLGRKIAWERDFRARVRADSTRARLYGDVWDRLAALQEEKLAVAPAAYLLRPDFLGGPLESLAQLVLRTARGQGDTAAARRQLAQAPPLDTALARDLLALRLDLASRWLPPEHPFRRAALRPGEAPAEAAARLLRTTRLLDVTTRQRWAAGAADTAQDDLLRLVALMDSLGRPAQARWQALQAEEAAQQARLARALFAAYGTAVPPDATFTLRISDGVVRGYPYNGTQAPARTTFYGLFDRALAFGQRPPWNLPPRYLAGRNALDLATPLNFVATTDITGGNSGSPVVDRQGRVVGVAFDSNVEGLAHEFLFLGENGRTVAIHTAAVLEALRVVYRADALTRELVQAARAAPPVP